MKKIAAMVLLSLIFGSAVFAQEESDTVLTQEKNRKLYTVTIEGAADMFFMRSFLGDYAEREPTVETGSPPYMYQGDGTMRAFTGSGFTSGKAARIRFSYEDDIMGGLLELRQIDESGFGTVNVSINRYVRFVHWDWNVWTLLFNDHLKITAGNTAQRGQIDTYSNFDGFLRGNIGSLGVFYPEWRRSPRAQALINNLNVRSTFPFTSGDADYNMGFADFRSTDTLDMFFPAGLGSRQQLGFLIDFIYDPVSISFSAGGLFNDHTLPIKTPWITGDGTRLSDYDHHNDPVSITALNFGLRIEAAEIADMVNLAAVYKFSQSGLAKVTAPENDTLNFLLDERKGSHAFGVYANLNLSDKLGITAGWSGLTEHWRNPFYEFYDLDTSTNGEDHAMHWLSDFKEVRFPFFNGIDLRFHFTGSEKLSFTSNNNFSFASVQGTDSTVDAFAMYANGWAYTDNRGLNPSGGENAEHRKETYLGFFNALGMKFEASETFAIAVQAASHLGLFTLTWEEDPRTSRTSSINFYTGVNYQINGRQENVKTVIRTGLTFNLNNYKYHFNDTNSNIQKAGYFDFGIPFSIALSF